MGQNAAPVAHRGGKPVAVRRLRGSRRGDIRQRQIPEKRQPGPACGRGDGPHAQGRRPRRPLVLLTKSLLFVAQQGDMHFRGFSPRRNALEVDAENKDSYLWAYDPETGEQVAEIPLPGNAFGSPMTYEVNGKQHIVLPLGGAGLPAELISLTTPDVKPEG